MEHKRRCHEQNFFYMKILPGYIKKKKKHIRQCLANVQLLLSDTEPQLYCRDTVKPRYN